MPRDNTPYRPLPHALPAKTNPHSHLPIIPPLLSQHLTHPCQNSHLVPFDRHVLYARYEIIALFPLLPCTTWINPNRIRRPRQFFSPNSFPTPIYTRIRRIKFVNIIYNICSINALPRNCDSSRTELATKYRDVIWMSNFQVEVVPVLGNRQLMYLRVNSEL